MPSVRSALLRRGLAPLILAALTGSSLAVVAAPAAATLGWGQVLTFPPVADVRLDQGPVPLKASTTAVVYSRAAEPTPGTPVVYLTTTPAVCTISGDQAVLVSAGTCSIKATAPGDDWFGDAEPVTRAFQVLPLPELPAPVAPTAAVLRLAAPEGAPLSAGTVPVRATSTGAAPITLRSRSPKVCRISATGVRLTAAGTCTVVATQAADDQHAAATAAKASFPVWATPALPATARITQVVRVLGTGEDDYRLSAAPADVCRVARGDVAMVDGGVCRVVVRSQGRLVRTARVEVTVPARPAATPTSLDLGATVYFRFNSARLSDEGRTTLRGAARTLRKADLVVVYGHTFGPGRNSAHSRALAARRARSVVAFLSDLGIPSRSVSEVAMAMQQPVSEDAAKNRRAEVYFR